MKKTLVFVMAGLLLTSGMVFARGQQGGGKPMVGYAVMRMVDEYWGSQVSGMKAATKANGSFILDVADDNNSGETCVENVRSLLSRGAKVIMVSTPDAKVGPAIMELCKTAKVPLIASDVYIDGAYFLTHDEVKAGSLMGDYAADYFNKHFAGKQAKVAILTDQKVASQVDQRIKGFETAFTAKIPNAIYLPKQDANGLRETAANLMAGIITANPDVNICFAINDDEALGAAASVQAAGKANDIAVFGQGGIGESPFKALLDPSSPFKATAAFMPAKMGEAVVNQMIVPLLQGKQCPKKVSGPLAVADISNAQSYLDDMAKEKQ
jgi:ribose transport system substrate-binding protein